MKIDPPDSLSTSVAELRRKAQEHSAALWQLAQNVQSAKNEVKSEEKEEDDKVKSEVVDEKN